MPSFSPSFSLLANAEKQRTRCWQQFQHYWNLLWYLLLSSKFAEGSEREEVTKVKRWPFPGQGHALTIGYKKVPVLRVKQTWCAQPRWCASWLCTVCVLRKSLSLALYQFSPLQSVYETSNESPVVVCPSAIPPHSSLRENSLSLTHRPHSRTWAFHQGAIWVNTGRLRARPKPWERENGELGA